ncbi:hypothetical protein ACTFIU_009942 [Dictyostelium citrinum]
MENKCDTVIIGGGLSVLKARNRYGGRTDSIKIGNGWVDAGGQWLSTSNPNTKQL